MHDCLRVAMILQALLSCFKMCFFLLKYINYMHFLKKKNTFVHILINVVKFTD